MDLASMHCVPDADIRAPLTRREVMDLLKHVPEWRFLDGRLTRTFENQDFPESIVFFNEIADLASREGHIPDMAVREHRYVDVSWYSHHCGGLTLNDFIMAAKVSAREFTKKGMSL